MSGPLSDARLAEIAERARLAYDGGDPLQTVGYDVPALVAEIRRLRGELNDLARASADANDALLDTDAAYVRLGNDLGARDAELAALQVEHEDLKAAYDRLGEQAQRIVEATSRFRAERDRLHDALTALLLGPIGAAWESSGAGDVRSPWIPAAEVAGWRQMLARTERSEPDGEPIDETAQNDPVPPAGGSRSALDANDGDGAQRGAVGRDGYTQAGRLDSEGERG